MTLHTRVIFNDITYLGCFLWYYVPGLFFMILRTWVVFYDITYLGCFKWHYIPGLFFMTLRNPSRAISTCFSLEPCAGGLALFWFSIIRECRYCAWDPMKSNRSIVKPLGFCQINDTRKLVYDNVFQIDIGNCTIILKIWLRMTGSSI